MAFPKQYKNDIKLSFSDSVGLERREELLSDILQNSTPLPKPLVYEDIDNAFKEWVEKSLYITYDGKELPTMTLFSNQRFSEYSQTWQYSDINNNIILNFKTITRENNPKPGSSHNNLWNIPGDRFYLMARKKVLDNNGTESFLDYKMKQPFCVDLMYKLSIFTNKYQLINDFNLMINDAFKARQVYITPNGHKIPMTLESINDESEYNIDDRQFFSQTYIIRVMAYIITENDMKVEEIPARFQMGLWSDDGKKRRKKATAEIEDWEPICKEYENGQYYYKPITLMLGFPLCSDTCKFTIDTDFIGEHIEYINVCKGVRIFVNDEEIPINEIKFSNGDEIKIKIKRYHIDQSSKLIIQGYDTNVVYDAEKDLPEVEMDFNQPSEEIDIVAKERPIINEKSEEL